LAEDNDHDVDPSLDGISLEALHVGLSAFVRDSFGLKGQNDALLADCGTTDPTKAASIIIRNAWQRLTEGERSD